MLITFEICQFVIEKFQNLIITINVNAESNLNRALCLNICDQKFLIFREFEIFQSFLCVMIFLFGYQILLEINIILNIEARIIVFCVLEREKNGNTDEKKPNERKQATHTHILVLLFYFMKKTIQLSLISVSECIFIVSNCVIN